MDSTTFDESLSPEIDFQVFQYDLSLQNFFKGEAGMLCWPSSLAHRMIYFAKYHKPAFSRLQLKTKPAENVAKFTSLCRTSPTGGTSQKRKLPCIRQAFAEAQYTVSTLAIGVDSKTHRRAVSIEDLLVHLKNGSGVILHVSWLRFDATKKTWIERGSHSLNAYGFDYMKSWGQEKIILKVVNPGMDYSSRANGQMYDQVVVQKITTSPGVSYPAHLNLRLEGPGFDQAQRLAVLRNIYVFLPQFQ